MFIISCLKKNKIKVGWGGENIDQSLRIWLCGGEIVSAADSYVAHMWRDPAVPKTRAKYRVPPGAPQTNRMRAVKAWYGDFFDKVVTFPEFKKYQDPSRLGDLSSILDVKESLKCKPFSWYMDRFPNIYHAGGLLPDEIVMLQWRENNNMRLDAHSNRCLSRPGMPFHS